MKRAAIIAHGQPGDPAPLQADLEALAGRVGACLGPGWDVIGATLACPCSLRRAAGAGLVYPLFMAEGWFTRSEMPRRLAEAGAEGQRILPPLGAEPALPALGQALARQAVLAAGIAPEAATLVVVGHGTPRSRGSSDATRAFATVAGQGWAQTVSLFLDEAPFLAEARITAPALCLPYFATNASHTVTDIPEAWAAIGAPGPIAPAIGTDAAIPAMIAATLARAAAAGIPAPAPRALPPAPCACEAA